MAHLHLAADDRLRAVEDALLALREEGDAVVRVDEGEVDGQGLEDGGELREGEAAGADAHGARAGSPPSRQSAVTGVYSVPGCDETEAEASGVGPDRAPLLGRQLAEGEREEDRLLLDDHALDLVEHRRRDLVGDDAPLLRARVLGRQGLAQRAQHGADVVVLAPHDLRRAQDAVPFEVREEDVLLARVVLLDLEQLFVQGAPAGEVDLARQQRAHLGRDLADRLVLEPEGVDGMARASSARAPARSSGRW